MTSEEHARVDAILNEVLELGGDAAILALAERLRGRSGRRQTEVIPEPGTRWRHHNGNHYTVTQIANLYSERPQYPVTVVYEGENGRVWARRLRDWYRSFTPAP